MCKENAPASESREDKNLPVSGRIELLDALRGLSILLMVAYHAGYDLVTEGYIPWEALYNPLLNFLEPLFAGIFIALAGISSRFSKNNLKRGLILLGAAALVTAASLFVLPAPWLALKAAATGYQPTAAEWGKLLLDGKIAAPQAVANAMKDAFEQGITLTPEMTGGWMVAAVKVPAAYLGEPILFGILHFMSACILLYALLEKLKVTMPAVLLAAFMAGYFQMTRFPQWPSADYFPLLPWAFLFFFGVLLGDPIRQGKFPRWFYRFRMPFLPAAGRHTLLIYLVHQPVLLGAIWLFGFFFPEAGVSPPSPALSPSPTPLLSPSPLA